MPLNAGFGRRLRDAKRELEQQLDRDVTYEEVGHAIAKRLKRKGDFTSAAVTRWFGGREPESFAVVEALASFLKSDPGYLAFGIVTVQQKAPAELGAEADENARRLKTGEPLITRDVPGAPVHPPRVHEDDRHLYETLKDRTERKKRGRRKRA